VLDFFEIGVVEVGAPTENQGAEKGRNGHQGANAAHHAAFKMEVRERKALLMCEASEIKGLARANDRQDFKARSVV
jgi:hypothetical protein